MQFELVRSDRRYRDGPDIFVNGAVDIDRRAIAVGAAGIASFLRMMRTTSRLDNGDIIKGLVFHAIWTSNLRHVTYSSNNLKFGSLADCLPEEMFRPVNVLSIAGCLRIPYETARRHVKALVKEGRCVRMPRGIVVPRNVLNAHLSSEVMCAEAPNFLLLFPDLKHAGFDFTPFHRWLRTTQPLAPDLRDTPNFNALARVGAEYFLRCREVLSDLSEMNRTNLICELVYLCIWQGDTRLEGPNAQRIALGMPAYRAERGAPVKLRIVADALAIPYETVRRHANDLRRQGRILRVGTGADSGYCLAAVEFSHHPLLRAISTMNALVSRLVSDLYRAGFDFSVY
jgi:DNA-binding IscR family transcriptional regulator